LAAELAAEVRWGPLRAGDEVSLRESREAPSWFLIEAGPGRARRAAEFQRAAPGLPPGQAGYRILRIEVQARETFLVLRPLPPAGVEGDHELWIPGSAIRQVRVWQ
jgi:hypothetical protein